MQDSSESAGGGLSETQEDHNTVERVTVVKFRVDNRGSDGTGCFRIESKDGYSGAHEYENSRT